MDNIVAIIVARGGSVEVPGKNIKMLTGKPLIAHTIESALEAELVDRVIVSTDDDDIARVSEKYGADLPFMRPSYLGRDAMMWPYILSHALAELSLSDAPSAFVALAPTYPIREKTLIDASVYKVLSGGLDGCISMGVLHSGVWSYRDDAYRCLTNFLEMRPRHSRQPIYQQHYGLATTISCDIVRQCRSLKDTDNISIVVPEDPACCIDINSELDFRLAEHIMSSRGDTN